MTRKKRNVDKLMYGGSCVRKKVNEKEREREREPC